MALALGCATQLARANAVLLCRCLLVAMLGVRTARNAQANAAALRTFRRPFRSGMTSKRTAAQAEMNTVEGIGSKVVVLSGNRGLGLEVVRAVFQSAARRGSFWGHFARAPPLARSGAQQA